MFGYVTVNKDELKVKDYERYRGYYCGLCHTLKRLYGATGRITLSYDMTFLVIFLTGLYESMPDDEFKRCVPHLTKKHRVLANEFSEYAADMNILLTYNNLKDDWIDDRKLYGAAGAAALKRKYNKACKKYDRQAEAVNTYMQELIKCEKERDYNLDRASGLTGRMLAEIFVYDEDVWAEDVRAMAFYLGKFIYIMDAYEDVYKDKKTGNYNPLMPLVEDADFEGKCESILTMMAADCSKAFERLPIIYDAEILRNILYSGIWTRFEAVKAKRQEKEAEETKTE
ncbi:MAG: hypothetical protein IJM37_08975 [Lachnospiraceae bacterium]|nr:hypothetical protein [Lachnospiraceae bacterium]